MNEINPLQKKTFLPAYAFLVMLCMILTGCDDTEKGNYKPYFFTMKILSVQGEDITPSSDVENIRVLVFDSGEKLIDNVTLKAADIAAGRAYTFYYENEGQITVACIGNTSSSIEVGTIELGDPITKLNVSLRANASTPQSAKYLYYGINKVNLKDGDAAVIELQQVTGSITVEAYIPGSGEDGEEGGEDGEEEDGEEGEEGEGGEEGEENEPDEYTCKITTEYSRLNYEGKMTGDPIQYEFPLTYSSSYDKWRSEEIILMPGKLFEVGIYKNGELFQAASSEDVFSIMSGCNTTIVFYTDEP